MLRLLTSLMRPQAGAGCVASWWCCSRRVAVVGRSFTITCCCHGDVDITRDVGVTSMDLRLTSHITHHTSVHLLPLSAAVTLVPYPCCRCGEVQQGHREHAGIATWHLLEGHVDLHQSHLLVGECSLIYTSTHQPFGGRSVMFYLSLIDKSPARLVVITL